MSAPYIVPGEKPEPVPDSPQARAPEAAPAPDGQWRRVDPDEIFEPARSFRVNISSGHTEVLEPNDLDGDPPSQPLVIDRTELTRFVNAMFAGLDPWGYVSLRAFPQRTAGKPLHIEAIRLNTGLKPVVDAAVRIAAKVCNGGESGVFAPPVCTFADRKTARAANVHEGPAISIDIDAGELLRIVDRIALIIGARPTIVLHSGSLWTDPETGSLLPKGHAHWRLARPARGPEQLRLLRRARDIATLLVGGDPSATPPVHPMRWPGTWNLKTDRPVMARIVEENDSIIDLVDALAALEEAAQLANLTTPRNVPHLAQPDTTPAEVAQIMDWLSFYPNTAAVQWNDWNSCAMAIHRVTAGSEAGFEAFRTWSATSPKHSDADCRARWDAITGSPATWIGANHLRRKASEHGWVEPTPELPAGWEQAWPTLGGNAPRPSDPDEPPPTDDDVLGDWVPPHTLPQIIVYAGERHLAVDQGLAALAVGCVPFYQRGQDLVRICLIKLKLSNGDDVRAPAVSIVTLPMLMRALSRCATWCKFNDKKKLVRIDPPAAIGEQIMGMIGEWPFPPLRGVIATQTMRHDGTLLTQPGYDPATGLVLFNPPSMPEIPDQPTKQDALDALAKLNDLLTGFEFADDGNVSRSVAISMLMTPVLRGMMAVAPMHVITKPEAGTGGSYLQDLTSAIATGERCPVLSLTLKNDEENEKRLSSAALRAQPIIAIDNFTGTLMGDFLCQLIERPMPQVRLLGKSELVTIINNHCVIANGNNATIGADTVRRTLQIRLDANVENPETRTFARDPVAEVLADRGPAVAAVLTVARAYRVAGMPGKLPQRLSFGEWSDNIRGALLWLHWPDPVLSVLEVKAADPIRGALVAVITAWAAELQPNIGYYTSELVSLAGEYFVGSNDRVRPALWEALFTVAGTKVGLLDAGRLGLWLQANLDRVIAGHKLLVDRDTNKARPRWLLAPR